ncbi:MAG: OmpA family protein [Myxococcota bacterium]
MRPHRTLLASGASALALGLTLALGALAAPPAHAQDFRLHLEPALGLWVDAPQSDRFSPGLYFAVRPGVALGRVVSLQLSYALLLTPAASPYTSTGSANFLMAGVRLRPLAAMSSPRHQLGGLFVDFNMGYVRTDNLDRFGFDVGLGYAFQLTPGFALGLVARYGHIVQPDDNPRQDPNDGQFMTVGLDLGFGPAYEAPEEQRELVCEPPTTPAAKELPVCQSCLDYDKDGVCDASDRCPTQAGSSATWGCPLDPCKGAPIVARVQFAYDSAALPSPHDDDPQSMDPVLDAVARAVAQDPTCNVCIVGFASEEGPSDHNLTLSRDRATAVQGYMTARGLAPARTPATGLGEGCQLVPEKSLELNRRVEFRRLLDGQQCPTSCTK